MRDALEKKGSPCLSDVYLTHNDVVAGDFSFHLLKIAFIMSFPLMNGTLFSVSVLCYL